MQEQSMDGDRKHLKYLWKSYFEKQNGTQSSCRPQSCVIRRQVDFDYKKTSPVYILRDFLNNKKSASRIQKSRFKSKQYLKERLNENCNVFMTGCEVDRRDLQNILWEKNYLLKSSINQLKEENNNVRAKVWKFQKENRKMQKQIESWNLEKYPLLQGKKTLYLDSNTIDRVFQDQDYSVVTMKIELARLESILAQRTLQISENNEILQNAKHHQDMANKKIATQAKKLMRLVSPNNSEGIKQLKAVQERVSVNGDRIQELQHEYKWVKSSCASHLRQKQKLERLEEPLLSFSGQENQSTEIESQMPQQPLLHLKAEIQRQCQIVCDLQYQTQEVINESLSQKQQLRRKIRQLEKELAVVDDEGDH